MTAFSGNWFQRRAARRAAAKVAYRGLLRYALEPTFFESGAVPDTFEGRAGMVTIMSALAFARLSHIAHADSARLVSLIDDLVLDGFDAAYRESGVGDHSIARKVRKLAQQHAGLGKALFAALTRPDPDLRAPAIAEILLRNGAVSPDRVKALSDGLLAIQAHVAEQPDAEILQGRFDWYMRGR